MDERRVHECLKGSIVEDSPNDALMLAVHDIMAWTLVGLVVAWRMKPELERMPASQTV